jgi:hypothetical protein
VGRGVRSRAWLISPTLEFKNFLLDFSLDLGQTGPVMEDLPKEAGTALGYGEKMAHIHRIILSSLQNKEETK